MASSLLARLLRALFKALRKFKNDTQAALDFLIGGGHAEEEQEEAVRMPTTVRRVQRLKERRRAQQARRKEEEDRRKERQEDKEKEVPPVKPIEPLFKEWLGAILSFKSKMSWL